MNTKSPQKRMELMPADRKNPIYYNNWRKRLGPWCPKTLEKQP